MITDKSNTEQKQNLADNQEREKTNTLLPSSGKSAQGMPKQGQPIEALARHQHAGGC